MMQQIIEILSKPPLTLLYVASEQLSCHSLWICVLFLASYDVLRWLYYRAIVVSVVFPIANTVWTKRKK